MRLRSRFAISSGSLRSGVVPSERGRFTRQNLLEVTRQDYIRTARAKGLDERVVILKHAFPNTLIPLITLMSLTFPFVLSGSVILETMFNWPVEWISAVIN